ncbi:hypothetical protein FSP39_001287 [Pinctada imbricata]|uniref:Integrase catalytic domain-containing protein n=1 Tax=Pinctada imbricata TaxID=66713 RepID=A0AA89BWN3_PINIB|nr:hypothetical protein FSP39_001287 [Pinctada imbricata]
MLESALKLRINNFPKITAKEPKRLYELADLLSEVASLKNDPVNATQFAFYDSASGVKPIVCKLPPSLQEKWTSRAARYQTTHHVVFPPFSEFLQFVKEMARIKNNPSFMYDSQQTSVPPYRPRTQNVQQIAAKKTTTDEPELPIKIVSCPYHESSNHTLNQCRAFRSMTIEKRRQFLRSNTICLKCCENEKHDFRKCAKKLTCSICKRQHPTALHEDRVEDKKPPPNGNIQTSHGGETQPKTLSDEVTSTCTEVCGEGFSGKSCAKIQLVWIYPQGREELALKTYVVIDDQSTSTLGTPDFFDKLGIGGTQSPYILSTCSGKVTTWGRRVPGLVVESFDRSVRLDLPIVTECEYIPDNRHEIPTPEIARAYSHLSGIELLIPSLDSEARISLLIGRDLLKAHHVLEQLTGSDSQPYAQRLPLGWTIVGETCLGYYHSPSSVNVLKTQIMPNGRPTSMEPCMSILHLNDDPIFVKTPDDEKIGMSVEDQQFLDIVATSFRRDEDGFWTSPLPFRPSRPRLDNNFPMALKRARNLQRSLLNDSVKASHFIEFMQKILKNGHAERAPPLQPDEECWFLPIFAVYNPQKPGQARVVFDSSAKFNGLSLNDVLLTGPDLVNSLLGVLMRFRREPVAVLADIQQMFFCFRVEPKHRNFLRFLWHEDSDLNKPLVQFRMCVHVFGNRPSPAVATYGLRLCIQGADPKVVEYIEKDFYVDDALASLPSARSAITLVKDAQEALMHRGNIRLHKIASNNHEVMAAFANEDLAKDIKDLDLRKDSLPVQASLGVKWDLGTDSFLFRSSQDKQPFTRRGVLSTINSIYDPLGFMAPVVIKGKLLLRELIHGTVDWDEPLPEEAFQEWDRWRSSLLDLNDVRIRRPYLPTSYSGCDQKEVHIYCDASEKAIAAVAYLSDCTDPTHMGFILGKAKVAPLKGHTVPRLELCSAVLAVEIADIISQHLSISLQNYRFHTDSKIVLGYIYNTSRRFHTYVANRVARIHATTSPQQWRYIPTDRNPADDGTRSLDALAMQDSAWLQGPVPSIDLDKQPTSYELQDPDSDKEIRATSCLMTKTLPIHGLSTSRFKRFSSWSSVVNAIAQLKHFVRLWKYRHSNGTQQLIPSVVDIRQEAHDHVLKEVQKEAFSDELYCLRTGQAVAKTSPISSLDPYFESDGFIRVGGRIMKSRIPFESKHPILLPGQNHISELLVTHYHNKVLHQGRHFTEGAVRSAGLWITRCKRLISNVISACVPCRKMRGRLASQKMADLPADRLEPGPPFSNVGVDAFGPYQVMTRKTRGGSANSKRWGILFTCLVTRAIHIELVDSMSSAAFINALRRFIAMRGTVKIFRSDRGTNFIGALDDLGIDRINVEDDSVQKFLISSDAKWIFNPPHAAHYGGAWERLIGVVKRILNSVLSKQHNLTHDVLNTLMAEVSAIVNARPLTPVSSDPDNPTILSPSLLLTQKPPKYDIGDTIGSFSSKDVLKSEWKRVQGLANTFWSRWKSEYLHNLQPRRKWQSDEPSICEGDIVLLNDSSCARNQWPMSIVLKTFPSEDNRVRKVLLRAVKDGKTSLFTRPVTQIVPLISLH